jgi:hypothetical protein
MFVCHRVLAVGKKWDVWRKREMRKRKEEKVE